MAGRNRCSVESRVRPGWAVGFGLAILAVAWGTAGDAVAQQVPFPFKRPPRIIAQPSGDPNEEQTAEGVFHGDRETRKQLKKAKQLLKDGRFSEALPLLDDILESSQDYFDSTEPNQVARNGLK